MLAWPRRTSVASLCSSCNLENVSVWVVPAKIRRRSFVWNLPLRLLVCLGLSIGLSFSLDFLLVFVVVDRFFGVTFSDNLGVRAADSGDSTMADREGEEIAVAIYLRKELRDSE